jgi:hypothetical protein
MCIFFKFSEMSKYEFLDDFHVSSDFHRILFFLKKNTAACC